MQRTDVVFSAGGVECAAWLYRPDGDGPHPVVVMAHGFSATREQRLDAYADRFRTAGMGVLLFDYRHFGASPGEPRQLLDIGRQQADFRAAIAHARAIDWIDPARVALFGSSFSGGHVLVVAARGCPDRCRRRAVPLHRRPGDAPHVGARNIALSAIAALRDQLGALVGRPPYYVPAVGPPGTFAMMTSPDAEPGFAALTPAQTGWVNQVSARVALRVGVYRPGRVVPRLDCPVLFCVCDRDAVTPARATLKYAARPAAGRSGAIPSVTSRSTWASRSSTRSPTRSSSCGARLT